MLAKGAAAGCRVRGSDDMGAAKVGGGGGECEGAGGLEHGGEGGGVGGVAEADDPGRFGQGAAAERDVAAGVDAEVPEAVAGERVSRALDGPALDVAARIEGRTVGSGHGERVEHTAGVAPEPFALEQDGAHLDVEISEPDLAPAEAGDRAVVPIGAERGVDVVEPRFHLLEARGTAGRVVDVDGDGHAHDPLDMVIAGHGVRCQARVVSWAARAASMAACRDCW